MQGPAGQFEDGKSSEFRDDVAAAAVGGTPSAAAAQPTSTQLNTVADSRWRRLKREWIILLRIDALISLLILGGLATIGLGVLFWMGDVIRLETALASLAWLILIAWRVWKIIWYPPLAYRRARYRITPRDVEIRRGVWWRSVTNVPHSRIQHTDVTQGPIERHYGIGTLIISTAGTVSNTVVLPGLPYEQAMRIRDYLIQSDDNRRVASRQPDNEAASGHDSAGGGDDDEQPADCLAAHDDSSESAGSRASNRVMEEPTDQESTRREQSERESETE